MQDQSILEIFADTFKKYVYLFGKNTKIAF